MKKKILLAIACLLPAAAFAAPPEAGSQPLWELGVGGGYVSTPAYPGADVHSSRFIGLPFLLYRGKVLRIDQSGIGARVVHTDRVEFDVGLAASLPANSKDVAARAGMRNLGTLGEFGPRLKVRLADFDDARSLRFELPVRAVIEARAGLRRQGWTMEPRLVYQTIGVTRPWNVEAQLGAVFGDARINRYFYEVTPQDARPDRPAYAAGSGLMLVRTGLFAFRRINPDLRLFGFVRYETYAGSANRASPLMKQSTGASAGFGVAWTFARSGERAQD